MVFDVDWSERAERTLSKLPRHISSRIARKVDSIRFDPFHYLEHYRKILEKNFEIISKFQRNFTITREKMFTNSGYVIIGH